jgi:hypothetical protein
MSSVARLLTIICAFFVGLGPTGCSPSAGKSWGCGGGTAVRVEDGATIDYTIERLTCDDRVYLILAANGCNGGGSGGGSGNSSGALYAKDGRLIAWQCSTRDAKSGKVVIDDKEFDLISGGLFLVSTKETPLSSVNAEREVQRLPAEKRGAPCLLIRSGHRRRAAQNPTAYSSDDAAGSRRRPFGPAPVDCRRLASRSR